MLSLMDIVGDLKWDNYCQKTECVIEMGTSGLMGSRGA